MMEQRQARSGNLAQHAISAVIPGLDMQERLGSENILESWTDDRQGPSIKGVFQIRNFSTMRTHTKLALLKALREKRNKSTTGFTLVEVLVVAGILAILFASLVPNLLAARSRAAASAVISETVGIARACQGVMTSGVGSDTFASPNTGEALNCSGVSPFQRIFTSRPWNGLVTTADNIKCLGELVESTTSKSVQVTVAIDGTLTCADV